MADDSNIPVIDYGGTRPTPQWVSLRKFLSPIEAQFVANELETSGIRYQLFGQATRDVLAMYGSMVKTDL